MLIKWTNSGQREQHVKCSGLKVCVWLKDQDGVETEVAEEGVGEGIWGRLRGP